MAIKNAYLNRIYEELAQKSSNEPEFLQAVYEVLESLQPVVESDPRYERNGVLERLVEPERIVSSGCRGWMTMASSTSTGATGSSSIRPLVRIRVACGSIPL